MHDTAGTTTAATIAKFQRREWAVQRIGRGVLGALLIAGAAGVFGRVLASTRPGQVRITFELEPQRIGVLEGRVGTVDSPGILLHQLVYP